MADISLFQAPNGDEFNIKDTTARSAAQQAQSTADSKISSSLKGSPGGVAELDERGFVPSSQLPSFVDDVIEGYLYEGKFYKESTHTTEITGESGKIYVDITEEKNQTYRWSGSAYVEISPSLALGETSSTAYRGDRGKIAYDHATESGKVSSATAVGLYKVGSTAQGHISGLTAVTKSDITALGIPAQLYGECTTDANVAAKTVTVSDFVSLQTGMTIYVKFRYYNSASNPTLNVNSSGAKVIRCRYSQEDSVEWFGGQIVSFTYDGTIWIMNDVGIKFPEVSCLDNSITVLTSRYTETDPTLGTLNDFPQGYGIQINSVNWNKLTNVPNYRLKTDNDFDTINVTELNAGDVVVTGVGRFTNGLYGNLTGNADTATNVAWSGVTGKPSTYPPSPHSHAEIYTVGDYRSSATTPNDYKNMLRFQGLKSKATIDSPSSDTYSYLLGLRGWADNSGGDAWELAFNNSGINVRHGATTTWGSWTKLLDSSNYNDYAPTKTGTGASGTWGISISGTATTATNDSDGNAINTTYVKKAGGTFTGRVAYNNVSMPLSTGKVTNLAAGTTEIFKDAIAISNPTTANDVGWIRVLGTGESDTVLEIATGDDGGAGESIIARQYNTSSAIVHSFELLDKAGNTNASGKIRGVGTSNADTASSSLYANGAFEVRESGFVGSGQSSFNYAPRIGFHWSGRIAASLSFHSDGIFYLRSQNGTSRASLDANLIGNADTATKATQDNEGHTIISTYVKKAGDTMSGGLTVGASNSYSSYNEGIRINAGARTYATLLMGGTAGTTSGTNDGAFWLGVYNTGTTARRLMIAHNGSTTTGTYFYADSSSQVSPALHLGAKLHLDYATTATMDATSTNPQIVFSETGGTQAVKIIYSDWDSYRAPYGLKVVGDGSEASGAWFEVEGAIYGNKTINAAGGVNVNTSNSGTSGGLSLWGTAPTSYGIAMRNTGNGGKHGGVQSDYAIYTYMTNSGTNRGWIWKNSASGGGNIASIDCLGNAVFNGYVGIGGNTTNTSGVRQVYDATTKSLSFVFVN